MKILHFDLNEAPEDATEFYYKVLRESASAGFRIPGFMLGFHQKTTVSKEELFEALVITWYHAHIYLELDYEYVLTKDGSKITLVDPQKSPPI